MQAMIKKKCNAQIILNGKSTHALTYSRFFQQYKWNSVQPELFFCLENIKHCTFSFAFSFALRISSIVVRRHVASELLSNLMTKKDHQSLQSGSSRLEPTSHRGRSMHSRMSTSNSQKEHVTSTHLFRNYAPPVNLSNKESSFLVPHEQYTHIESISDEAMNQHHAITINSPHTLHR